MRNKWNDFFTLMVEASKHPNRSTFARKKRNAYNAAKQANLLDAFFPPTHWTKWASVAEATRYNSRSAFRKASPRAFAAIDRNGLLDHFFPKWERENDGWRENAGRELSPEDIDALNWK